MLRWMGETECEYGEVAHVNRGAMMGELAASRTVLRDRYMLKASKCVL